MARVRSRGAESLRATGCEVLGPDPQRDAEWNGFLQTTPGGHHLQSTQWAHTKSVMGWRAVRVGITDEGRIRGGAQVLFRGVAGVGSVAYVPRGPVLGFPDGVLGPRLLDGIDVVARHHRARLLVVQPPIGHDGVVGELAARGFRPASRLVEPHPTATVVVDVSAADDALLAGMNSKTRYNVRKAEREGVSVREGGERDVAVFHRLLTQTGRRQGFAVPAREYVHHLFRAMASGGRATILLAEYQGEPVSAALLIAFGDTVVFKRGAWSGRHGARHPNELLHWTALRWARREGYRYYDLEGIDPAVAGRLLAGAGHAGPDRRSVSTFKLGFGGRIVLSPGAYERVDNPVLRHGYQWLVPRLLDRAAGRWLVDAVRTR